MKGSIIAVIFSSVILGSSIVMGCFMIQKTVTLKHEVHTAVTNTSHGPMLTLQEAANFLSISEEQLNYIIQSEQNALRMGGSFQGEMVPYLKIKDELFFSAAGLVSWVTNATTQRRQYIDGTVLK